jgi:hypothetical protein
MFIPDPDLFTHFGSRIQGSKKEQDPGTATLRERQAKVDIKQFLSDSIHKTGCSLQRAWYFPHFRVNKNSEKIIFQLLLYMTCVRHLGLVLDNLTLKTSNLLRTDSGLSSSLWMRSSPVMSSYRNAQFTFYCNQMVPKTATFLSFLLASKKLSLVTIPLCSFFSQERLQATIYVSLVLETDYRA